LPCNPETIVGEILGERARKGANPAGKLFQCPYIKSTCTKRSTSLGAQPYPLCSIWKGNAASPTPGEHLICVCPKRFHAIDFLTDVIEHCWPGPKPANPRIAPEVQMKGFGNVDFVVADLADDGSIGQFLSVELQAIDITGSVRLAYEALREGVDLDSRPTYGLNWDNVYKRYITQLIRKGYFHAHWNSKIVAVIQEQIYRNIVARADFMRTTDLTSDTVNIIFMTYRFGDDPDRPGEFVPVLATVEGTGHANLQQAMLYKKAPSRDEFCERIVKSLTRVEVSARTAALIENFPDDLLGSGS